MSFKKWLLEKEDTYVPTKEIAAEAQKALDYREKYPDEVKAGTRVGWTRANQLAKREKVSFDTVKRMHSFFSRHDGNEKVNSENKDTPYKDNGFISFLLWGGEPGKKWAEKIINSKKE